MSASRDSLALSLVDGTSVVLVESDYDLNVEFSDSSDESLSDLLPPDAVDELDDTLAGFVAGSGHRDGEIRHDGDEDEDDDGDSVSDHDDGKPSEGSVTTPAPATFYRGIARWTTRAWAHGRASTSSRDMQEESDMEVTFTHVDVEEAEVGEEDEVKLVV